MNTICFQKLTMRLGNIFVLLCLLIINMNPVQIAQAAPGNTIRVSVASDGAQGNSNSYGPSISAGTLGPCVLPPAGLVSWWPGDGNANDIVGSNDGTLVGGVAFTAGKVGQAFNFDGIDDIVLTPAAGFPTGAASRTVAFWTKISPLADHTTGFAYGTEAIGKGFYVFPSHEASGGELAFSGHGGGYDVLAPTDLRDGLYHHVAVTYDGTIITIYADGISVASESLNLDTGISGGASIGGRAYMGEFLVGEVDEVTIWNRVLATSEIQAMFSAGSAGMCKDLTTELQPPLIIVHGWQGLNFAGGGYHCSNDGNGANDIGRYPATDSTLNSKDDSPDLADWLDEDYDVWIAHLETTPSGTPPLHFNAVCLKDQIKYVYSQNPQEITIVAHSMGGLVSRAAIWFLDPAITKDMTLYTLGSPHAGMPSAIKLVQILPGNQDAVDEIVAEMMVHFNENYPNIDKVNYYFLGGHNSPKNRIESQLLYNRSGQKHDGLVGVYSSVGWVYPNQTFEPSNWTSQYTSQYWTDETHSVSYLPNNNYYSLSPTNPNGHSDAYDCIKALMDALPLNSQYCRVAGMSTQSLSPQTISAQATSTLSAFTELKTGHLNAGQSISIPLVIDTNAGSLFYLTWSGDTPTLTLTRPDNQSIDPAYAISHPEEVTYETSPADAEAPAYIAYNFNTTQSGTWQLNITATGAIDYQGFAALESKRTLTAQTDKDFYQIGDTATVTANLDSEGTGLSGATVTATLTRPDDVVDVVTLTDQGNGAYTNTYTIPDAPGFLTIDITASGNDNGTAFSRQETLLVAIAPNDLQLTGNYGDQPRDDNSDGFYDYLDFTAEANLATAGEYALSAELYAGDQLITQSADFFILNAGMQTITLPFDGGAIQNAGLDGPYIVKNLYFTPIDIGIAAASVENAWTTNAYSFTQFVDKEGPQVSSITRADANPTNAASVRFTVTFSEAVTGVDAGDFELTPTGMNGAGITDVTGSGPSYTVSVNTGTGNGAIQLNMPASAAVEDLARNPLENLPFTGQAYSILKTATFGDVPNDYWAWSFVERLYQSDITSGCSTSPVNYCPENGVTRAQMAVFLLRGMNTSSYTPPAIGDGSGFGDVPPDYWAAAWIKQLAAEGITTGCGGSNFCPDQPVTRAQMAVFLLRSNYGTSYIPPGLGAGTGFLDVPPDYWAAAWIKQLITEGTTAGCGNGNYCPEQPVTRAQMAVFLVRTFGLP
jgi:hypothetical protein